MKVTILGGGINGILSAYFLARSGCKVEVLDQNSQSASGCSGSNGGQLSFSHAEPWASKSSIASLFKALVKPSSFLSIDNISNKEFLKWVLEFYKNSNAKKSQIITERILKLGFDSRKSLQEILSHEKLDFNYKDGGILHFYRSEKMLNQAAHQARIQKSLGCDVEILSANQCVVKEPTLVKLRDDNLLKGGIFFKDDASGNPVSFIKSLEAICKNNLGVEFYYNTEVKNILTNYKKITGINTNQGVFVADNYLFCLGSYGNNLLGGVGIKSGIMPVKGYSLSIPTDDIFLSANTSLTDPENRIVYSKLGNIFRAAGTVEVCGLNQKINNKNIEFIKNTIKATYSDFGDLDNAKSWYGFRPYRADCTPLVCKIEKYGNLFVNSGHGSLGWTLSFSTSKLISKIILGEDISKDFNFLKEMEKKIYI